jgi:hypothetical protein
VTNPRIALVTCDNAFVQHIDASRLERLQALGRIDRVVRSSKGRPVCAFLHRTVDDPKPTSPRDYLGAKYSFRQNLGDGHRCYRLRALGNNPHASEYNLAPAEVRPIFMRVLLECMA